MDEERDVEVFERIPWESLEDKTDRRWMAYALAGVIVLAAVGVSLGRQMTPGLEPVPTTTGEPSTTLGTVAPSTTAEVAAASPGPTTWSEADLMALPGETIETGAMAVAEWYVVDFFTRDDPEGDRSFVEWARAWQMEWDTPTSARVTVLVRRLAAPAAEPYHRLEEEAWDVEMELDGEAWSVASGPVRGAKPDLVVRNPDPDGDRDEGEWTDDAGVTWPIQEPLEDPS